MRIRRCIQARKENSHASVEAKKKKKWKRRKSRRRQRKKMKKMERKEVAECGVAGCVRNESPQPDKRCESSDSRQARLSDQIQSKSREKMMKAMMMIQMKNRRTKKLMKKAERRTKKRQAVAEVGRHTDSTVAEHCEAARGIV